MEIEIIEESKDKLVVEIKGEGHGFVNMLKKEVNANKDVKAAGYNINHPLIGVPKLIIHSKKDPKKVLLDAAKNLKKQSDDFLKAFNKVAK